MQWIEDPNIVGYMSINGKRLEIFFEFNITGRPNAETLWTKLIKFLYSQHFARQFPF